MKFLRNKWFWIILAIVVVVVFFMIKNKQNGQAPEYVTAQIFMGNFFLTSFKDSLAEAKSCCA